MTEESTTKDKTANHYYHYFKLTHINILKPFYCFFFIHYFIIHGYTNISTQFDSSPFGVELNSDGEQYMALN